MKKEIDPFPLSEADLERISLRDLQERMQRDFERIMFGGWPPGYEPGKGMPGTITVGVLGGRVPPICGCGPVFHRSNCKYANLIT